MDQWNKPLLGSRIDPEHPLSRGLVGCWLMNEGSGNRIYDISGNGNDGVYTGVPNWQLTSNNYSIHHNDIQYITFKSRIINYSINQITVLWFGSLVNLTPTIRYFFVGQYQSDGGGYDWGFYVDVAPLYKVSFFIKAGGGTDKATTNEGFSIDKTTMLVGRYDGSEISIWRNSIKQDIIGNIIGNIDNNWDFKFGHQWSMVHSDARTILFLAYNRALSAQEIQDLYINPYGFIYQPNKYWLTKPLRSAVNKFTAEHIETHFIAEPVETHFIAEAVETHFIAEPHL